MRSLVLSCACLVACYSPHLKRCTVLCVLGGPEPCPSDMTCSVDGYCHEAGDTTTCAVDTHFTVTVTPAGTGSGVVTAAPEMNCPPTCAEQVNAGTSVELLATPNGDSRFVGWAGPCTGADPTCVLVVSSNATVDVNFNRTQSLTVEITGAGSGDIYAIQPADPAFDCNSGATPCTQAYDQGTSVTLMAVPEGLSSFSGWGSDCASATGTTCTVVLDDPVTASAAFD